MWTVRQGGSCSCIAAVSKWESCLFQEWESTLRDLVVGVPVLSEDEPAIQKATLKLRNHVAARARWLIESHAGADDLAMFRKTLQEVMKRDAGELPWAPLPKAMLPPSAPPKAEEGVERQELESPPAAERPSAGRPRQPCVPHVFRFLQTESGVWTVLSGCTLFLQAPALRFLRSITSCCNSGYG